ncbi:MAG: TonB-dependent receptor plug domain-containing protein [Pseudomonadales bacterium]|nr:TonB-dependent receptor plug domain-containing protein [Pseudomonadales bacterium]
MRKYLPALLLLTSHAWAHKQHGGEEMLEEIVVYGRSIQQIGSATSASEGIVGYQDIQLPPLLRVGELVEAVPGMVATQHSGTGKANQYFLRGFNLDHGTDFSAAMDGVPLNMRTHGHGQGYLDLNPLIPELVKTTRYQKGPYAPEKGDFSSAGAVDFEYYTALPDSLVEVTVGEDAYRRILAAGSTGDIVGAVDVTQYDGPWEINEDLTQYKAHVSWSPTINSLKTQFALDYYDADWNSTDQVPRRAVESGLINELGFIDPDLGGSSRRFAARASV